MNEETLFERLFPYADLLIGLYRSSDALRLHAMEQVTTLQPQLNSIEVVNILYGTRRDEEFLPPSHLPAPVVPYAKLNCHQLFLNSHEEFDKLAKYTAAEFELTLVQARILVDTLFGNPNDIPTCSYNIYESSERIDDYDFDMEILDFRLHEDGTAHTVEINHAVPAYHRDRVTYTVYRPEEVSIMETAFKMRDDIEMVDGTANPRVLSNPEEVFTNE